MKNWNRPELHMYNAMQEQCNRLITELVKDELEFKNIVIIERIANILIIRLRKFIKAMDDEELYVMLKAMPALRKMRAPEKHKLVNVIRKFWI